MNKTTVSLICVLAISTLAYGDGDNQQYWAVTSFSFRLNDTWKLKIKEDFRFRDGGFFEQQNEALFACKLSDRLDIGLGFRQVHKEDASHEWQRENRPAVEFTVRDTLWGLNWSDRNRLEFREFENKKDVFRYRNRLKIASPHPLFDLPAKPYVAEEFFIQEGSGFNRNRIYAGLLWDVNKLLDIDFFVIHQRDKTGRGWDSIFITGFETIFSF